LRKFEGAQYVIPVPGIGDTRSLSSLLLKSMRQPASRSTYFSLKEFSMKLIRNLSCACMVLATALIPAFAQTVITSPTNGQ
jgi:hypothetical protein